MIRLADANILLALVVRGHGHHRRAAEWLSSLGTRQCAVCRVTQMALLRHLTNRVIMREEVLSQQAAWDAYDALMDDERLVFLPEPLGLETEWRADSRQSASRDRWTDAYLAAFAISGGLRLSSFDRGFARFAGLDFELLGG